MERAVGRAGARQLSHAKGPAVLGLARARNREEVRKAPEVLQLCEGRRALVDEHGHAGNPVSTSMGPFAFFYAQASNGTRHWRRAETLTTTNANQSAPAAFGQDGNGVVEHVVRDHDCYFTDGAYSPGADGADNGVGMGLLNFNSGGYVATCWLIIDD